MRDIEKSGGAASRRWTAAVQRGTETVIALTAIMDGLRLIQPSAQTVGR